MECILTLAGFYCFTIGFSFTFSHTLPASRLSWDQLQTMRGRESNHQPMGNQSHHLNHSCCCKKNPPRFPRKRPFSLPAFLLLSSSWVPQFPSFALLADVLGPPWLQRDGGKVSGWQAFLLCSPVIGHVHVSFLDFSFWTRTHRPKCKLLTSVTRSHLIYWIKELQQCFTTSLGDGNELSVHVWTCKFPCTMSYFQYWPVVSGWGHVCSVTALLEGALWLSGSPVPLGALQQKQRPVRSLSDTVPGKCYSER